jgi:hypothetical protein
MTLSGKGRRTKGVVGEREVRHIFEQAGFEVRGLEGQGDHLVVRDQTSSRDLHLESKRQERLRVTEWIRQAEAECPTGCVPVVCFRRSRERWYAVLALEDLVDVLQ